MTHKGGIAFIGDTQETLLVERLIGREDNRATRGRLVDSIAAARPALVVHLGDAVAISTSAAWRRFDELMRPLGGVPLVAVRGNHDLWGRAKTVEREWNARFHGQERVMRSEGTAIVLLDSNRAAMGERSWRAQREWLAATLRTLDDDASCARIICCAHHPPCTNSTVTSDDVEVARDVLPVFIGARKTRALVSGHVHAYERFDVDGPHGTKHLIVAGGAGGPRVRLHTSAKARHVDMCALPSPRPMHYLWLEGATLQARDVTGTQFDVVAL